MTTTTEIKLNIDWADFVSYVMEFYNGVDGIYSEVNMNQFWLKTVCAKLQSMGLEHDWSWSRESLREVVEGRFTIEEVYAEPKRFGFFPVEE